MLDITSSCTNSKSINFSTVVEIDEVDPDSDEIPYLAYQIHIT